MRRLADGAKKIAMSKTLWIAIGTILLAALVCGCGGDGEKKPDSTGQGRAAAAEKARGAKDLPERGPGDEAREAVPVEERGLLVFGLDGADWRAIDPLLAAGKMPNFAKLIEAGARAPLETFEPCLSPLIWTTLATGLAPRKHGITGFTAEDPESGREILVSSNLRRVPALWNLASRHGIEVGVAGWWGTYPAERVRGFVVSDQASALRRENYRAALDLDAGSDESADRRGTWPPGLAGRLSDSLTMRAEADAELLGRFMDLPKKTLAELADDRRVDKENIFSIFQYALFIDRAFLSAFLEASAEFDPQLGMLYLNGLDAAEHHFWKFREPEKFSGVDPEDVTRYGKVIDNYYIYMDEVLGRLLERYPLAKNAVLVVSDHGHEANEGYDPQSEDHFDRVCSGSHEHAPDGIFLLAGADVRAGAKPEKKPTIFDVTPTALALLGVPVGRDMPGRVLEGVLETGFLEKHPPRRVKTHSAGWKHGDTPIGSEVGGELKKKLEGLGYIE